MEFAQAFLTAVIEVVAIAGFGGILLHALHSSHCKWLKTYCPPVKNFEPAEETMQEEISAPATQAAVGLWVPQQAIAQHQPAQAQEEANAISEKLTEAEIDAAFKVPVLRALCDSHGIVWKDVRGKNRHALKPAMIQALMSANAF